MGLVDACIAFASASNYTLFHADATFKLSDLGYPMITCGFTDASRSYQLAAIFVVSRRIRKEYSICLKVLVRMIKRVHPSANLHIDAVMGDAEDAQMNGFQQVPEFASSTYLMCFFHMLYNVRKRTKYLIPELRSVVMYGIIKLHFTENMNAYYTTKEEVLAEWGSVSQLTTFRSYFTQQWLDSRYWRWQIFHTPMEYAVTNNPCETFNALLKKYTGRRRYYMQRLLKISQKVVHNAKILQPTRENSMLQPTTTVIKAANSMIATGRLVVYATENAPCVALNTYFHQVKRQKKIYWKGFCVTMDEPFRAATETSETQEESELLLGPALLVREQRVRGAKLYKNVVTWSLQYAHTAVIPENGWIVDVEKCVCGCKFYCKFKICSHVLAGRKAKRLGQPGTDNKTAKPFNHQVRKVSTRNNTERTASRRVRLLRNFVNAHVAM